MTWSDTASKKKTGRAPFAAAAAMALAIAGFAPSASAEVGQQKASTGAKATVGMAFLGAEAVLTVEALVGVKPWWGYAIGGGLGAIAGGVGGYFIDRMDKPGLSMGLLTGGIVLAVPTAVAVLSATAYRPEKNPAVDSAQIDRDLALMQSIVERHALAHYQAPPSFMSIADSGQVHLAMPAVSVQSVYEQKYRNMLQLRDAASVRVPVLNISF